MIITGSSPTLTSIRSSEASAVVDGAAADHCRPSGVGQDEQSGDMVFRLDGVVVPASGLLQPGLGSASSRHSADDRPVTFVGTERPSTAAESHRSSVSAVANAAIQHGRRDHPRRTAGDLRLPT